MLLFFLLLWGLVYLWTGSKIMMPLRMALGAVLPYWLLDLCYCPPCAGFWFGLGLSALGVWPHETVAVWAPVEAAVASTGAMAIVAAYVPLDTEREIREVAHLRTVRSGRVET